MVAAMGLSVLSSAIILAFAAAEPQAELPAAPTKFEVLEYEVKSLQAKNSALEGDKQALLRTIRGMLWNNQTAVLQRQLVEMSHRADVVEERSAQERSQLQAEAKEADRKAEAAAATAQEAVQGAEMAAGSAREAMRKAKDENTGLAKLLRNTQLLLEEENTKDETLTRDKQHLLQAMSGLLRQNAEYAHNATAKKSNKQRRKKDAAAALKKLRTSLRRPAQVDSLQSGGTANDTAPGVRSRGPSPSRPRLRRSASMKEDPIAYMGDTRALTSYIANFRAKAWAAKEAGTEWIDQPGGSLGATLDVGDSE